MKNLSSALLISFLVLFLQIFTFSVLLGNDIISRTFQILLYGPLLGADRLLHHARRSWGVPVPTTMFGGFPDWLDTLLLLMNWLVCSLLFFVAWRLVTRVRTRG